MDHQPGVIPPLVALAGITGIITRYFGYFAASHGENFREMAETAKMPSAAKAIVLGSDHNAYNTVKNGNNDVLTGSALNDALKQIDRDFVALESTSPSTTQTSTSSPYTQTIYWQDLFTTDAVTAAPVNSAATASPSHASSTASAAKNDRFWEQPVSYRLHTFLADTVDALPSILQRLPVVFQTLLGVFTLYQLYLQHRGNRRAREQFVEQALLDVSARMPTLIENIMLDAFRVVARNELAAIREDQNAALGQMRNEIRDTLTTSSQTLDTRMEARYGTLDARMNASYSEVEKEHDTLFQYCKNLDKKLDDCQRSMDKSNDTLSRVRTSTLAKMHPILQTIEKIDKKVEEIHKKVEAKSRLHTSTSEILHQEVVRESQHAILPVVESLKDISELLQKVRQAQAQASSNPNPKPFDFSQNNFANSPIRTTPKRVKAAKATKTPDLFRIEKKSAAAYRNIKNPGFIFSLTDKIAVKAAPPNDSAPLSLADSGTNLPSDQNISSHEIDLPVPQIINSTVEIEDASAISESASPPLIPTPSDHGSPLPAESTRLLGGSALPELAEAPATPISFEQTANADSPLTKRLIRKTVKFEDSKKIKSTVVYRADDSPETITISKTGLKSAEEQTALIDAFSHLTIRRTKPSVTAADADSLQPELATDKNASVETAFSPVPASKSIPAVANAFESIVTLSALESTTTTLETAQILSGLSAVNTSSEGIAATVPAADIPHSTATPKIVEAAAVASSNVAPDSKSRGVETSLSATVSAQFPKTAAAASRLNPLTPLEILENTPGPSSLRYPASTRQWDYPEKQMEAEVDPKIAGDESQIASIGDSLIETTFPGADSITSASKNKGKSSIVCPAPAEIATQSDLQQLMAQHNLELPQDEDSMEIDVGSMEVDGGDEHLQAEMQANSSGPIEDVCEDVDMGDTDLDTGASTAADDVEMTEAPLSLLMATISASFEQLSLKDTDTNSHQLPASDSDDYMNYLFKETGLQLDNMSDMLQKAAEDTFQSVMAHSDEQLLQLHGVGQQEIDDYIMQLEFEDPAPVVIPDVNGDQPVPSLLGNSTVAETNNGGLFQWPGLGQLEQTAQQQQQQQQRERSPSAPLAESPIRERTPSPLTRVRLMEEENRAFDEELARRLIDPSSQAGDGSASAEVATVVAESADHESERDANGETNSLISWEDALPKANTDTTDTWENAMSNWTKEDYQYLAELDLPDLNPGTIEWTVSEGAQYVQETLGENQSSNGVATAATVQDGPRQDAVSETISEPMGAETNGVTTSATVQDGPRQEPVSVFNFEPNGAGVAIRDRPTRVNKPRRTAKAPSHRKIYSQHCWDNDTSEEPVSEPTGAEADPSTRPKSIPHSHRTAGRSSNLLKIGMRVPGDDSSSSFKWDSFTDSVGNDHLHRTLLDPEAKIDLASGAGFDTLLFSRLPGQANALDSQGQSAVLRPQGQPTASNPQQQANVSRPQGQSNIARSQPQPTMSRPQEQAASLRSQEQTNDTQDVEMGELTPRRRVPNPKPEESMPKSSPPAPGSISKAIENIDVKELMSWYERDVKHWEKAAKAAAAAAEAASPRTPMDALERRARLNTRRAKPRSGLTYAEKLIAM